jgi:hypothetical protein
MSYDLNFACGKTIDEVKAALEDPHDPDCTTIEQRRVVAKRLMEVEDGFELFESPNCIELSHPKGIQVSMFGSSAAISFPYWHEGAEAVKVFEKIRSYAKILVDAFGYAILDPQIDALITPESIGDDQVASNDETMKMIQTHILPSVRPKPWWKFW